MNRLDRRQFISAAALSAVATALPATETERKFTVAVIGHTGHGDYGHGIDTMWLAIPEAEMVAVADADAKGLAKAQERLKFAKGFADYRAMLAGTKPGIVAIGPRHIDEHRDMILAACEAGARGIYIEKPFCRSPAEADEIVAACEKRNVKLAVAHRNRYHPALKTVKKMLEEQTIGRLLEIRGRGKEDKRGGVLDLWVLGSHLFNLVHHFAGAPRACSAMILQAGRPVAKADLSDGAEGVGPVGGDELHARFEMESGIPAFFDSVREAGIAAAGFGLQFIGTKGIIDIRIDTEPVAQWLPGNPFQPAKEPRTWIPITSAGAGEPEPIAELGKQVSSHALAGLDLIAAIRENRDPLCSARDARVTIEMICAALESHRLGGVRVGWPLQTRQNPLTLL
jgi:predicted dehydrogenase